jgi:hypothetical protein
MGSHQRRVNSRLNNFHDLKKVTPSLNFITSKRFFQELQQMGKPNGEEVLLMGSVLMALKDQDAGFEESPRKKVSN